MFPSSDRLILQFELHDSLRLSPLVSYVVLYLVVVHGTWRFSSLSLVHPKIEIDLELAVNELRKRFPQLPSTFYAYDACTLRVFRSNFHQIIDKTNSSNFCRISSEQLSEDVNSAMKG